MSQQKIMMEARGFITVSKAAELAGVEPQTIYRWLDTGVVQSEKVGPRSRYVNKASLEQHLGPLRTPVSDATPTEP